MSSTRCVLCGAKAATDPLFAGTLAMFEVMAASEAFRVETCGGGPPPGHRVRKSSGAGGTTVAFSTYAWAEAEALQFAPETFTARVPEKGGEPAGFLVSNTRQGGRGKKDRPPATGGAKYPFTSITRSESSVTNTDMSQLVPAGTMAALAVIAPLEFRVETRG